MKPGIGARVSAFRVMDVITAANARAAAVGAAGPAVLRMEVGQPGTGLPEGARLAVEAALRSGDPMGYTEALGRGSLRDKISGHIRDWYGTDIPSRRVAVTTGASGAFPLAFLASFEAGDEVALATPYYPPYLNILVALGLTPVVLPCGVETGFQPTVSMLEALPRRPAGLILASPANPTGSMLSPEALQELAVYCDARGIRLISDEIYHGLTYGKPAASASQFSASAIVINSFSKYFSMTGWRVGWMVMPEDLIRPIERLAQNLFISAPYASQVAAEAALGCHEELQGHRAVYAASRDILIDGLQRAGFRSFPPPDGAFYIYVDISGFCADSADFCARLLAEQNIAATPGHDFDAARGQHYVRLSYCAPLPDIEEAVRRLHRFAQAGG
jgi:aspartate/methionine/tyrosine aminotransferase